MTRKTFAVCIVAGLQAFSSAYSAEAPALIPMPREIALTAGTCAGAAKHRKGDEPAPEPEPEPAPETV